MNVRFLLYDVQSAVNMGQILRVAETFHIGLDIYDPRDMLGNTENYKTVSDFSCGAFDRLAGTKLLDRERARAALEAGRVIATTLGEDSVSLPDFRFANGDVILFGNEYDGLPPDVMKLAKTRLYVPLPKGTLNKPRSFSPIDPTRETGVGSEGVPNLSVSVTCSIIAYTVHVQRMQAAEKLKKSFWKN